MSYYVWEISFEKSECEWGSFSYTLSETQGNGKWSIQDSFDICTFIYHSSINNDGSQPTLPDNANYPYVPSSKLCNIRYGVYITKVSRSGFKEPELMATSRNPGEDKWKKITPFEYKLTQSIPIYCADKPTPPSLGNVLQKYDSDTSYRIFFMYYYCDEDTGYLEYGSGPTYVGSTPDRGDGEWEYKGFNYLDNNGIKQYRIEWVSDVVGSSSFPSDSIPDDLYSELEKLCTDYIESSSYETPEETLSLVSTSSISYAEGETVYEGNLVFSVKYDCATKTLGDIEIIDWIKKEDSAYFDNEWTFYNTYETPTSLVHEFRLFSTLNSNIDYVASEELAKISPPTASQLASVACYHEADLVETLLTLKRINFTIDGVIGDASAINSNYTLTSDGDLAWSYVDDNVIITFVANESEDEVWSIKVIYTYGKNKKFTSFHELDTDKMYLGKNQLRYHSSSPYRSFDTDEYSCLLGFVINLNDPNAYVGLPEDDESSSQSDTSESSSSSESLSSQNVN